MNNSWKSGSLYGCRDLYKYPQELFGKEENLRAEVEQYGQARPPRNAMLDWASPVKIKHSSHSSVSS